MYEILSTVLHTVTHSERIVRDTMCFVTYSLYLLLPVCAFYHCSHRALESQSLAPFFRSATFCGVKKHPKKSDVGRQRRIKQRTNQISWQKTN